MLSSPCFTKVTTFPSPASAPTTMTASSRCKKKGWRHLLLRRNTFFHHLLFLVFFIRCLYWPTVSSSPLSSSRSFLLPANTTSTTISWPSSSTSLVSSPRRSIESSASSSCSICPNPNDSITLPNQSIPLFGTCGDLENLIAFITPDSDNCRLIQSVSTICGCPISKSSCFLCGHNYEGPIDSNRPVPYLLEVPDGINVTCEIVQAYLHSISYDNQTCTLTKALVGPYCDCPATSSSTTTTTTTTSAAATAIPCSLCPSGAAASQPDRIIHSGLNLPFLSTCGDLENVAHTYWQANSDTCRAVQSLGTYCGCNSTSKTMSTASPCTFCSDGSPVTLVNKTIPFLKDQVNLAGLEPTCGLVEAALQSIPSTDALCTSIHLFSSHCGCPAIPDHCVYCPKPGDAITKPNVVVKQFNDVSNNNGGHGTNNQEFTCEQIWYTQFQVPSSSDTCWKAQSKNFLCGCNQGQFDYLGADTIPKKRVLAWMPRITAMLSFCGSLYILMDIYRHHRKPKLDQYHELVACICFFDISGSVAGMFTTLPIPTLDNYGQPTGIYGAHGTMATCKAQAFFFQLGFTGIFYTLALSIYYVLVVNYNYRESDMTKVRRYFHLPLLVGLSLAFAGIPYYDNNIWLCHVPGPPLAPTYRYINAITLIPLTITIVVSACAMLMVYIKVLRQSRTANRWRFGNGGGAQGKLSRQVFWQAFFFVVALYGSWPIMLLAEYSSDNRRIFQLYWFWVIALTLAPCQGFFNFFVYFRPKVLKYLKQRRRQRRQQEEAVTGQGPRRPTWARMGMRLSFPSFRRQDGGNNRSAILAAALFSKKSETRETTPDAESGPLCGFNINDSQGTGNLGVDGVGANDIDDPSNSWNIGRVKQKDDDAESGALHDVSTTNDSPGTGAGDNDDPCNSCNGRAKQKDEYDDSVVVRDGSEVPLQNMEKGTYYETHNSNHQNCCNKVMRTFPSKSDH